MKMNTLNEYQTEALTTANYPRSMALVYPTLGLNGEAGEVAEKVKKLYRDHNGVSTAEQREAIALELDDVLWYVATCASDLGYSLSQIASMNINKLASRKARGVINGNGDYR